MLMEVKKSLKLLGFYMKFNLSAAMEYRFTFVVQVLGMALNNSAFLFFWWILFENAQSIGGYGFKEVMLLWSLTSTAFGITFVLFGKVGEITQLIINGELDTFLLQPKSPLMNIACSKTRVSAWGDLFYGVVLYFFAVGFDPLSFAMYVIFSVSSCLIFASVMVIVHTCSFYFGDFQGIADLTTEFIITFSIYPEGIFADWMKYVFYTILPIGFYVYIPARTLVAPDPLKLLMVFGAAVLWMIVANAFFYRGLKRYESGNLIISRL